MPGYRLYKITSENTDATIVFRCQFDNYYTTKWLVNLAALPLNFENEIISYVRKFKSFQLYCLNEVEIPNGLGAVAQDFLRRHYDAYCMRENIKETFHVNYTDGIPCKPSASWKWENYENQNNDPLLPNEVYYPLNDQGRYTNILENKNDSDRVMLRCFLEDFKKIISFDERKTYLHGMV